MDSVTREDGPLLKAWKGVVGGTELSGTIKLVVFLVAYLLLGGLTLAQMA